MILIGRYLSPYTRRVAVNLKLLDIPFEHRPLAVVDDSDEIRKFNPAARVPALVLDDGEALIESGAIVDHLDEIAGSRALTPKSGKARRDALQIVGLSLGAIEKAMHAFYERTRRPAEFTYEPWAAASEAKATGAPDALEARAPSDGWFGGGAPNQADIMAVIAHDFAAATRPALIDDAARPKLAGLATRANALPAFAETRP